MKAAVIILSGLSLLLATHTGGHAHASTMQTANQLTGSSWWQPTSSSGPNNGPEWQWVLGHPLSVTNAKDMGTGALNAAGQVSAKPTVYDIDGIENPKSTVTALHNLGSKAVCYIEIGSAGNYYAAADEGIPVSYYAQLKAAGDLGRQMSGYPEYYLNINKQSTVSITESMIRQQCAAKGFNAVEPDIGDSYTDSTGFGITERNNIAYDNLLGNYAHSLGLAWGQKNGDNDPAFATAQQPVADFLLIEECNYYQSCAIATPPYAQAGKLVLNAEYTDDWGTNVLRALSKFCAADNSGHIDGTLFTSALAGQRNPCK
jgi:hypothetical protein